MLARKLQWFQNVIGSSNNDSGEQEQEQEEMDQVDEEEEEEIIEQQQESSDAAGNDFKNKPTYTMDDIRKLIDLFVYSFLFFF